MFRSGRAEEKEARRYNVHKEKAMEILFDKIQAEFEKEERGKNYIHTYLELLNKFEVEFAVTSCLFQITGNLGAEDGQSVIKISKVFKMERSCTKQWAMTQLTLR